MSDQRIERPKFEEADEVEAHRFSANVEATDDDENEVEAHNFRLNDRMDVRLD